MLTWPRHTLAPILASALALFLLVTGSTDVRADNVQRIEIEAQRCMASTETDSVSAIDCPEVFALLSQDSSWLATDLSADARLSREDLDDLHRLSASPKPNPSWQDSNDTLDGILRDYRGLKNKDPNVAEKFFEWLAEKFDGSAFGQRIAEFGENLRLPPDTLRVLFYGVLTVLAALALIALFVLVRTVFLNVSPRGLYGTNQNPRIMTGEERGNAPVLSLAEIRELPVSQQPAALLVAAVDFFRGGLLPDNPWAATNAEISSTVAERDTAMSSPLQTLINNAERTLYGEKPVTDEQIRASFKAATTILGSRGPAAIAKERA